MNRHPLLLAALAALITPALAGAAPIEGRWAKGKMQIRIAPCGSALCGTVIKASARQRQRAADGSGTNLIGATLIRDIRPDGPGRYRARVFVPDRNMHADGTIEQNGPNRLDVQGCVMLGLLCRSAQWTRVGDGRL